MGSEPGAAGRRKSLREIGRAAARVAAALARMAEAETGRPGAAAAGEERAEGAEGPEDEAGPPVDARFVRGLIEAERLRAAWFGIACRDPSWAVLLVLFLARLEGRVVRPSALAAEAALPGTTAARRVEALCAEGLIVRCPSGRPRRVAIALADAAAAKMERYLKAAMKL
jgi:MarR family